LAWAAFRTAISCRSCFTCASRAGEEGEEGEEGGGSTKAATCVQRSEKCSLTNGDSAGEGRSRTEETVIPAKDEGEPCLHLPSILGGWTRRTTRPSRIPQTRQSLVEVHRRGTHLHDQSVVMYPTAGDSKGCTHRGDDGGEGCTTEAILQDACEFGVPIRHVRLPCHRQAPRTIVKTRPKKRVVPVYSAG